MKTRSKNTKTVENIVAIYCHWKGFAIVVIQRIVKDTDYVAWQACEKRWVVTEVACGIASFKLIEQELKRIKSKYNFSGSFIINNDVSLRNKINSYFSFKPYETKDNITNVADSDGSVFDLVALVNDHELLFSRDCEQLMQAVQYYHPDLDNIPLQALILAIKAKGNQMFNYLLFS